MLDKVSIHAPREGCDVRQPFHRSDLEAVSIHAPREGCDEEFRREHRVVVQVSIHAPREGCDLLSIVSPYADKVSIHAPREGCDRFPRLVISDEISFNSRTP